MINFDLDTKYKIDFTSNFKKQLKKMVKQNKNIQELLEVVTKLANKEELDEKYKNHKLINDKTFKDCNECHIQPDWLLVYKIQDSELVLLLLATGSHSDLFNK
jgi:mRNA interferase YafQ